MNDKVYANYLMHGRTKGSRNGISTTKGYTAVGQKAKGHLVNGKYVYDAGVNLPTNYNGLDNYMKVSNSNKTQPYLHSLYPKGYANASDAMKNDPRYSSDSVYVVKYKGSDLNPKPVTKNDPDAKALRDYIGRLYVTNKQSVATNVAKAGKDKIALNKYDDKPQYLGHKELSDINNNLMLKKIKDEVASKLKAEKEEAVKAKTVVGSKNDWQQQAALEQWKQQNRNNIAASKKKKAEAFDKASDAYRLGLSYPVDQMANRTRTVNEHYNKNWKNNTTINYDSPGSGAYLDAKKAKDAAYLKGRNAVNKATMNGANTNASQQAELERWKQQNRNNIAASKKAAKQQELIKKADASYDAYQKSVAGSKNNWQQQANAYRSADETRGRFESGKSKDAIVGGSGDAIAKSKYEMGKQLKAQKNAALAKKAVESYVKGAKNNWQQQANAYRSVGESYNKVLSGKSKDAVIGKSNAELNTKNKYSEQIRSKIASNNLDALRNRVYEDQNKRADAARQQASYNKMSSTQKNALQNDPRYSKASTFNKSGIMKSDRIPYSAQMEKSTNKQELADAIGKNKKFISDMKESALRNSRSDIGNAIADAKEDAKNAFKSLKNKFKKKKKK